MAHVCLVSPPHPRLAMPRSGGSHRVLDDRAGERVSASRGHSGVQ